jgi:radical SAM superfamily enzyme YgiQ (UPF0313 family)
MQPDVLLVNPSIDFRTQNRVLTDIIRISFPMSLGHLAGYLEARHGWPVRIHDEQLTPLDEAGVRQLLSTMRGVKVVGITTLTVTSGRAYELARMFKQADPSVVTILGGIHASVLPEEGLDTGFVDYVVRGEGEETLSELLTTVLAGGDVGGVEGIAYRTADGVKKTPDRKLIQDIDALPPFPYHLFAHAKDKYSGFSSIQTSRGCPYSCIFCSQRSLTGRRYRYVSSGHALADIRLLVETYGARTIRILDDNIAAVKPRLMDMLEAIIASGLHRKVSFEAPMRGDNLDEEILAKLKEANFSVLTFGLETGSERLMKIINKGEKVSDVVRAITLVAESGITVGTTLIFGLPTETRAERWETIRLVNRLPLDSARYNILTPYPDTPLYKELLASGKKITVLPGWINFSVQYMWENDDLPYVPPGTDKYELILTAMFANLWFYLRPKGLRKMFTKSVAGGNVVVLPRRWYFSAHAFKMVRVGLFLLARFLRVCGKLVLSRFRRLFSPGGSNA